MSSARKPVQSMNISPSIRRSPSRTSAAISPLSPSSSTRALQIGLISHATYRAWGVGDVHPIGLAGSDQRSEEHTSELQSLMRISYAVFCLKKNNRTDQTNKT